VGPWLFSFFIFCHGHTQTYTDKNSLLTAFGWKNKKAFFISPASLEEAETRRDLISEWEIKQEKV
jgi:hypothetical protein